MNNNLFFFSRFWRRTIALCLVIVHFYFSTVGAVDCGIMMMIAGPQPKSLEEMAYLTRTDKAGKKTVVIFDGQGGAIKYTAGKYTAGIGKGRGIEFKEIGKVSGEEMSDIIATAPVVDNKDSAIITNTLVKAQEAKTQAQQLQWKQELQQMMPEMRDKNGHLMLAGKIVDKTTGEAGGQTVYIVSAKSAVGQELLEAGKGRGRGKGKSGVEVKENSSIEAVSPFNKGGSRGILGQSEYILILPQDPGLKTQDATVVFYDAKLNELAARTITGAEEILGLGSRISGLEKTLAEEDSFRNLKSAIRNPQSTRHPS